MPDWVDNLGLPRRPWSTSTGRPRKPLLVFRGHAPPYLQVGSTNPFHKGHDVVAAQVHGSA
eukprot:12262060-Prorocentrum_lima.AAC.1